MRNSQNGDGEMATLLVSPDRFEAIRVWAEYIREQPVDTWDPQHRELVDAQLASARSIEKTPEQELRIERIVEDLSAEK